MCRCPGSTCHPMWETFDQASFILAKQYKHMSVELRQDVDNSKNIAVPWATTCTHQNMSSSPDTKY